MVFVPDWFAPSVIILNILVWAFVFGKIIGSTKTRLNNVETRLNNPTMLKECLDIFSEIKNKLSNLEGKIEAIFVNMSENQKNRERKRTKK